MPINVQLDREFTSNTPNRTKLLLHYFGSNPYYAMARQIAGEIAYTPVQKSLTEEIIQQHLDGQIVVGVYHLNKDSQVHWLGWDVDSTDLTTAKHFTEKIVKRLQDISHAVEFSGGKGYHVLIFLEQPVAADKAKKFVDFIRDTEGLPKTGKSHVECYPKQSQLTKSLPMGSLLKLPLGVHPSSRLRSKFVDPFNGWENGTEIQPEHLLQHPVKFEILQTLIQTDQDAKKTIVDLLTPYWTAGERHSLALYLAGYLAHIGWGLEDATELMKAISQAAGDTDIRNRVLAVEDTFRNVYNGKTVRGYSGLAEMLPGAAVRALSELCTQIVVPSTVKQIDAIRLHKAASFEKIRSAANMIWASLQEQGEVVQTNAHIAYWYRKEDHTLTSFESMKWHAILLQDFGINPAESFGVQVTQAIKLRAVNEARLVTIQNRTVWDGKCLYVNLGAAEVYKLNGVDIKTEYNGECGFLFRTDTIAESIHPLFEFPKDVWQELITDLNFNKSADAPATPEEQGELLKAWILAFFFQELMPTKPLLLSMGVPGSGKTTAMRRILRVLESPTAEVLEVAGDKPDSLRASIASHRLLVLDNLEKSGVRWLVDTLNRLATGASIELRQLYKTNEVYTLKPNCFVAMTAVSMPFSEETLFSRILPLEMTQLQNPLPEYLLQQNIQQSMGELWADLLEKLNCVVANLNANQDNVPPIASRLADFTVFCKRIETCGVVNGQILIKGLRSLVDRQKTALLEASPFIVVLEEWLNSKESEQEIKKEHTFSELHSILEPIARSRKLSWRWNAPAALARHVMAMAEPLKKLYRAEFSVRFDEQLRREIHTIRFL